MSLLHGSLIPAEEKHALPLPCVLACTRVFSVVASLACECLWSGALQIEITTMTERVLVGSLAFYFAALNDVQSLRFFCTEHLWGWDSLNILCPRPMDYLRPAIENSDQSITSTWATLRLSVAWAPAWIGRDPRCTSLVAQWCACHGCWGLLLYSLYLSWSLLFNSSSRLVRRAKSSTNMQHVPCQEVQELYQSWRTYFFVHDLVPSCPGHCMSLLPLWLHFSWQMLHFMLQQCHNYGSHAKTDLRLAIVLLLTEMGHFWTTAVVSIGQCQVQGASARSRQHSWNN